MSASPTKKQKLEEKKIDYDHDHAILLSRYSNQAVGIAQYAIDFLNGKWADPDTSVMKQVEYFHADSVLCGLSALALSTNAPTVLRDEALSYKVSNGGATVFGSTVKCDPCKAICANSSAVREWDSNGTVFGYNKNLGKDFTAGEFGHNDFYPVVIAAAEQLGNIDGKKAILAMICLDEIRGRLCEVFSLKSYKIDHVVHGGIASAAVYGALMGASVEQIESAIGMLVAHYIPWRAIRAGHQLSDSKGASAALTTEAAILCVQRSMRGFVGPKDIFRNPEAIFRQFEPTKSHDESPFDLVLSHSGNDFAVMGMHFKLGLYEHQSAGALQGMTNVIKATPSLVKKNQIKKIIIKCYEPAFGIIGDPAKRNPTTRQSADHSMVYIVASLLRHAIELGEERIKQLDQNEIWKELILLPSDYDDQALFDKTTRSLMEKIAFEHGGKEYDDRYPDGIPTSVIIEDSQGKLHDSTLIMYPAGHARNTTHDLHGILDSKFLKLGTIACGTEEKAANLIKKLCNFVSLTSAQVAALYGQDCVIVQKN